MLRIDVLPDDVLLTIFYFYVVPYGRTKPETEKWISLVHVCRRWRTVVFGSPRYLRLRLFCTPETPAKDTLDVWPPLPLIIDGNISSASIEENIIVALSHNDRVHEVDLREVGSSQLENIISAMQVPFPKATHLRLEASIDSPNLPAVPDSFLGGCAPCLRYLSLDDIPFLGLSTFLLSTTHLVHLYLRIPQPGYIPPEEMVTCLSVLTSLKYLTLDFSEYRETQRSPPSTCSVLSTLTSLGFAGSSGYLEDLVARIDAPRLNSVFIALLYQNNFIVTQLIKFINRTPALKAPVEAHVVLEGDVAWVKLISQTFGHGEFRVQIRCNWPRYQLSFLVKILSSSSLPLFTVENLYIKDQGSMHSLMTTRYGITDWWEILRPFVAVKNIYLFKTIASHIACSWQELDAGGRIEMLPALQNIFLRSPEESIGLFVSARQLLRQTINISVSSW